MSCWIEARRLEIGGLTGRHREQAHSYNETEYIRQKIGRLAGRLREQARSHILIMCAAHAAKPPHSTG